jgi:hypothetical protein
MIKPKIKLCKGTGKAIGNGCGMPEIPHKFGLCLSCFKKWVFNTPEGELFLKSTQIRAKNDVKMQNRKEQAVKKEESRNKTYFEKQLETEVNAIVRLIDSEKGCISCLHGWETNFTRQAHAGHRLSIGSNATLRFNVFNIFKQCSICNNHKHANDREYDKGLIKHYGIEMLDYILQLPAQYPSLHLSKDELKESIQKARMIKKNILEGIDYTREEINQKIGIYK